MTGLKRAPHLGFLGTGWIGRHRMERLAEAGCEVAAVADTCEEMAREAAKSAPNARIVTRYEDLLEMDLDGMVIATPSALHAEQSIRALQAGLPVFCQKPLGRTAGEVQRVIEAACNKDLLLGVDFSYRFTRGIRQIYELISTGEIGELYAVDLTFHNAYGPDKAWFYDPLLSGGGCVMDLGVHLVDLALWIQGFPPVAQVTSRLYQNGRAVHDSTAQVEDYALARLDLENGVSVQLQCSWKLPVGADCLINASFFGSKGGLSFRNINGSFYDFVTERFIGTRREILSEPPDSWGGRAAVAWAEKLSHSPRFDPEAQHLLAVSTAIDAIYSR
ncbi:MAG: Gfo/Idh/MocA family protein [Bdellovibrionales bacterium]